MAAQLTKDELLAQEIQKMEERKASLAVQIKAHGATIKELMEQVKLTEESCQKKIELAKLAHEKEKNELSGQLDPLKSTISSLQQQIAAEHRKLADAKGKIGELTSERTARLADLDARIGKRSLELASVESIISDLKTKVSAI